MYKEKEKIIIDDVLDHILYSKKQIENYANQEWAKYKVTRSTDEDDENSEDYKRINKLMRLYEDLEEQFGAMEQQVRNSMRKFKYGELEFFEDQERWSLNIWPYDKVGGGRQTFSCGSTLQVKENGYWESYRFNADNGKYFIENFAKEKITLCEGMYVRIKE